MTNNDGYWSDFGNQVLSGLGISTGDQAAKTLGSVLRSTTATQPAQAPTYVQAAAAPSTAPKTILGMKPVVAGAVIAGLLASVYLLTRK